jgi:hypothetical protein
VTSAGTSNFILDDEEDEEEMPDLVEEEMPELTSDEHLEVHGFKRGFCSQCLSLPFASLWQGKYLLKSDQLYPLLSGCFAMIARSCASKD